MESARQKRDAELSRLIQRVRKREFPYEPRETRNRTRDWAAYTDAQIHEIHDTLLNIRRGVDAVPDAPRTRSPDGGPPFTYDAKDLAKTLLMQQYFEASNRVAQGYALLFSEKLGLARVPNYKAIERSYEDPDVRRILDDVFELTQPDIHPGETVSLDGTGLPRTGKANWESEKASKQDAEAKRARFDGSVVMMHAETFLATAHCTLIVGFQSESPTFQGLLDKTAQAQGGRLDGVNVVADAGFPSRANCTFTASLGATPYLFPKTKFTLAPKGSQPWRAMLDGFLDNTQVWLTVYHTRSGSEAFFSRHKRRHPTPLRKIIDQRRRTEKHARFLVDNLTQVGYLHHQDLHSFAWAKNSADRVMSQARRL